MKLSVVAIVLSLALVLVVLPSATALRPGCSGTPDGGPYECWDNHDHNALTFQRIDCRRRRDAASLGGCKAICTPHPRCYGLVFIPDRYGWKNGKICCFLKLRGMRCTGIRYQYNRITCRWLHSGGDSSDGSKGDK